MLLLFLLLLPLVQSGLCLVLVERRWIELLTVLGTALTVVLAVVIAVQVGLHGYISGLMNWLYADALSAVILLIVVFVSFTAALYSIGYMREDMREQDVTRGEGLRQLRRYYMLFHLARG